MNKIAERLRQIRTDVNNAAFKVGRDPESVKLLLATKTAAPEVIREAIIFDQNYIGENKVQELARKHPFLNDLNLQFHFIGHLQTNKVRDVLKYANCIQSIDRMSLVTTLDKQLQKEGRSMDVLLQVNTSYETSKFGVSPEDALTFAQAVSAYDTLRVKGLMTIGRFSAETEQVRKCFKLLADIKDRIAELGLPNNEMKELSMGMSNDFATAIQEGATIVRIGTAVFGQRMYPDSYYWNEQKKTT